MIILLCYSSVLLYKQCKLNVIYGISNLNINFLISLTIFRDHLDRENCLQN